MGRAVLVATAITITVTRTYLNGHGRLHEDVATVSQPPHDVIVMGS